MIDNLDAIVKKFEDLTKRLSDPSLVSNNEEFVKVSKEQSELAPIVSKYKEYIAVSSEIDEANEILELSKDDEMKELAREERESLLQDKEKIETELKLLLVPKDPNDERNVVLEIRAGTGGDEAALFAADLFRMYVRFAEKNRWSVEIMEESTIGLGGYKEVIALIKGKYVFGQLKYESGTHRVQRVPKTEGGGRIHTSAATVAVLPEATNVEIDIETTDLRIETYRASGAGGQHVNTTDSAVRITHLPTNLVVTCQDERSQHKNKAKAMTIMRARLYEQKLKEEQDKRASERKSMVGSGDRSERIRTYNFPQGRVTDHRINLTLYKLEQILAGELEELINPLAAHYQAEALK